MTIIQQLERVAEAFAEGTERLNEVIAQLERTTPKAGRRGHPVFVLETGESFTNIVLAAKSTGLAPTTVYRSAVMGKTIKKRGLTFSFDGPTTTTQDKDGQETGE